MYSFFFHAFSHFLFHCLHEVEHLGPEKPLFWSDAPGYFRKGTPFLPYRLIWSQKFCFEQFPNWPIYQPFKEWWVIVLENNTEKKRNTLVKALTTLHFCTLMCCTLCSKIRPSCVDRSQFFCRGTRQQNPPERHLVRMLTFSVPHLKFMPFDISVSPGVFLSGRYCLVS